MSKVSVEECLLNDGRSSEAIGQQQVLTLEVPIGMFLISYSERYYCMVCPMRRARQPLALSRLGDCFR